VTGDGIGTGKLGEGSRDQQSWFLPRQFPFFQSILRRCFLLIIILNKVLNLF